MRKEKKNKHFLHKPIYPGGLQAIRAFISKHLKYPEKALKQRVEGSVTLKYDIDYKGNVIDAKVISGLGYGCDEEAMRVVKLLRFSVEKTRGVRVIFHKNISIHFKLPAPKKGTPIELSYHYSTSSKREKKPENGDKKGYGYTIRF